MNDIHRLLERQSEWQKRRANLSWPEKIRMAEAMRETVLGFEKESRDSRNRTRIPPMSLK